MASLPPRLTSGSTRLLKRMPSWMADCQSLVWTFGKTWLSLAESQLAPCLHIQDLVGDQLCIYSPGQGPIIQHSYPEVVEMLGATGQDMKEEEEDIPTRSCRSRSRLLSMKGSSRSSGKWQVSREGELRREQDGGS